MSEKDRLARTVGLRELRTPGLEDVDRRRAQLWLLSLVVGLAVPVVILVLGTDVLPEVVREVLHLRIVRLSLLAMLVAVLGYVAEREVALRRLSHLLVEERVLTASLVSRVDELDLLLRATRAMNSTLELPTVLDVILSSAYTLLRASEGSIQLVCHDDPDVLEVAATRGATHAALGQRQLIGEGLSGGVAESGEPLLVHGRHASSRADRPPTSALVVPLQLRGRLVGVLNLAVGTGQEPFTEFHLRSVAVFAEAAAGALANARAHEAVEATVQSLSELDRMKNEFLAMVTHELRTPLTAIIGVAETVERDAERLPPRQLSDLARIAREQGWRLDRLVDDLLQTARGQQGKIRLQPQATDVARVVRESVGSVARAIGDRRIVVDTPPAGLVRVVDGDAVGRIVTNLVGNAAKHTPAGTAIEVTLVARDEGVVLTVTDDGPGIPVGQRDAIFDKFGQGERTARTPSQTTGGGLGLGLFIVRSLAEAHGGRAVLREAPSGGCRFVVEIKALDVDEPPATAPALHAVG